jgi:hypothetical protein
MINEWVYLRWENRRADMMLSGTEALRKHEAQA